MIRNLTRKPQSKQQYIIVFRKPALFGRLIFFNSVNKVLCKHLFLDTAYRAKLYYRYSKLEDGRYQEGEGTHFTLSPMYRAIINNQVARDGKDYCRNVYRSLTTRSNIRGHSPPRREAGCINASELDRDGSD